MTREVLLDRIAACARTLRTLTDELNASEPSEDVAISLGALVACDVILVMLIALIGGDS